MSWSLRIRGTREEVCAKVSEAFDNAAKNYTGTEEEKDVLKAKSIALSHLDHLEPSFFANDGFAPKGYLVEVAGWGSRSGSDRASFGGSCHVEVSRIKVE